MHGLFRWVEEVNTAHSCQPEGLVGCIAMITARLDKQEMLVSFLQERARNQMTVLYNPITPEDARNGIGLTRDSRSLAVASTIGSSSMRTLAALSVLFL